MRHKNVVHTIKYLNNLKIIIILHPTIYSTNKELNKITTLRASRIFNKWTLHNKILCFEVSTLSNLALLNSPVDYTTASARSTNWHFKMPNKANLACYGHLPLTISRQQLLALFFEYGIKLFTLALAFNFGINLALVIFLQVSTYVQSRK